MAAFLTPPGFASLSAATTGTGKSFAANSCKQATWTTVCDGTVSGGTILIEQASSTDYAGTWYLLDTITAANASSGTEGYGTFPGVVAFIRARISSDITGGGSVSVYFNGLQEV